MSNGTAGRAPCCEAPSDQNDRVAAVEHLFCELHRGLLGMPYAHVHGRDRKILKGLPSDYTAPKLQQLLRRFFDEREPFVFQRQGPSIPAFVSKLGTLLGTGPRLVGGSANGQNGKLTAADVHRMALEGERRERDSS